MTINTLAVRGRRYRPMHFIIKFALLSPLLFDGLVDPQLLLLTKSLLILRSMIMNPSHSNNSIANTQHAGQLWIEIALRYCANNRQLRLDVPNLHLLIETLIRSLPIVRNMRSALTTRHEAEHTFNKALVRKVSYNEEGCREAFALHARVFSKSLDFVFGGGKWGEELKHQLGDRFQ